MIKQEDLNHLAIKYIPEFIKYSNDSKPYQIKGIFNSELLMIITIAKELNIEQIIESGRARGQSTEIIGRFAIDNNIEFKSIESHNGGDDAEYAEERMKRMPGIKLLYGDSFDLMPKLIEDKKTLILIDGPKGSNMWKLFNIMNRIPGVAGIFLHDTYKNHSNRKNLQREYPGKFITTDDPVYVKNYSFLDYDCWKFNPWGPYEMGSYISGRVSNLHKCESYSATLSFVEL